MQTQTAALYVARGAPVVASFDGAVWRVNVNGESLRGPAGGLFGFSSAAAARNWLETAALKILGGAWTADAIGRYQAKLEIRRLSAKKAGNALMDAELQAEIETMEQVKAQSVIFDGGGAGLDATGAAYNRLEGGRP